MAFGVVGGKSCPPDPYLPDFAVDAGANRLKAEGLLAPFHRKSTIRFVDLRFSDMPDEDESPSGCEVVVKCAHAILQSPHGYENR